MSYRYFQNRSCEFFPCHAGAEEENFNCLFCYCPLYYLKENCGGRFTVTPQGIKDCSQCLYPHRAENYSQITKRLAQLLAAPLSEEKKDV